MDIKDLLSLLIPAIATVLTALITARAEVDKARQQVAAATPPAALSAPTAPAAVPRPRPPVYRQPVIVSTVVSLAISTSVVLAIRALTPAPPEIIVERLHERFSDPETLPGEQKPISVPPSVKIGVKTQFLKHDDRHVWLFVCGIAQQPCELLELRLDDHEKWEGIVSLGGPDDNCTEFWVGFAGAEGDTHERLNRNRPPMWYADLRQEQFLVQHWFKSKRDLLNDGETYTSCL